MPTDFIRYDLLVQEALRSVVRKVLGEAARSGLPGEHHFNISFKTQAPGVMIPAQMRQRYPDEMAIILQHEFWDLTVGQDAFEVSLNFSRKPERLTIPFDSITGFSDPSVPFGFKLEPRLTAEREPPAPQEVVKPVRIPTPTKPPTTTPAISAKPAPTPLAKPTPAPAPVPKPASTPAPVAAKTALGEKSAEKSPPKSPDGAAKIVSIDAFRKK